MFWRHLAGLFLALFLSGAAAGIAIAQSANVQAALTEASKALQKGGYAKAIEIIDGALRSGKVPSELAAKALLMRAEANEKLGRSAFALADYNNSLWMQGLSTSDRKRAEEGHARVMKGLGVSAPAATDTSSPAETGSAPAKPQTQAWNTDVQQTPAEERSSGGGIGSFFGNLFGSSSSSQQGAPEQAQPAAAAAVVTEAPPEEKPQGRTAPKKAPAAARSAAPAAAPVKPPETGNFAIQLAALAEEDKAIAETDRLAKKYTADLGGRTPSLMIVPTSDGGTLYKIVAAPFETLGEGQATCELLKSKGVSCMVITKK
jgi:cell division septation protein DedD